MTAYDRRAFVKQSAVLAAAAAAGRLGLLPASAQDTPGGPCPPAAGQPVHPFFRAQKDVDVIAHRGGKGQWPEETVLAFREAVKLGVDVLELDVRQTRDDVLVLMHDPNVRRTTDGKGDVSDLRFERDPRRPGRKAVQDLDAGHDWPTECGDLPPPNCRPAECVTGKHPFRGKGIRVPTLEEVFREFKASPGVRMVIEIKQRKPSLVAPFCELLKRHGMQDRVLVASFYDSVLDEVRGSCEGVATSAATCESAELFSKISRNKLFGLLSGGPCKAVPLIEHLRARRDPLPAGVTGPKTHAIQVPAKYVTKAFVERAHCPDLNLKVHAWTVNDDRQMREMLEAGVDGIITDCPGRLLEVRREWRSKSGR